VMRWREHVEIGADPPPKPANLHLRAINAQLEVG
jgi:hypothetical protein